MQQASALVQFLSSLFPSWDSPPMISQFTSGQSNPTFLLSATSPLASPTQLVLRTKPAGKTLDRTAHRVDKEYALLRALGEWTELRGGVRTPRVHGFCPQGSCDGWGDFYLMQYIKGRIFPSVLMPEVPTGERAVYWEALMSSLGSLSSLPPSILPSTLFPPPTTPFFARQVSTLLRVSSAQAAVEGVGPILTDEGERGVLEGVLRVGCGEVDKWEGGRQAIVWGDAKLDNVVFHPSKPEVAALLDWELCAIGSPLSDLGNCLLSWSLDEDDIPPSLRTHLLIPLSNPRTQTAHGLPSRRHLLEVWLGSLFGPMDDAARERKRNEVERLLEWVEIFIIYRLAIIAQGIQARVVRGQASSPVAREVGNRTVVGLLGRVALKKARRVTLAQGGRARL